MAQKLVTADVSTVIPGSYPVVKVISNPVGLAASGNIVIFGEADGGDSYQNVSLKTNFYTPDQLDQVTANYRSGQIVDAFTALSVPSADPNIVGSATAIYIVKTNTSTKASALVDTNYGTFSDLNWGADGDLYQFQVTSIANEVAPTLAGTTVPAFGAALNGLTFSISLNGGATSVVTLSATSNNHATISELITELNGLLPSGITASAGTATNSLALTVAADSAAYRKGWGKSFELIDSTPGDLAALGLTSGLVKSSQEPGVEVAVSRADINLSETFDASATVALSVGYNGTSATLTINPSTQVLTTTVSGGTGSSLNINLSKYATLANLVTYINAQPGYSASVLTASQQLPPSALDSVTNIGILSPTGQPGRVKQAVYNFAQAMSASKGVAFTAEATAGLPNPAALPTFLAGGARGGTAPSDIINALAQIGTISVNILVPLFSQDATKDIIAGYTDSSSTYTISAINALTKTHCLNYSTPELKKNRIAILSIFDTFANAQAAAQNIGFYRCAMTMQQISQVNSSGNTQVFLPWYGACIAAGMQAAGFYKSILNKAANIISYTDPSGYDSGDPGDTSEAIEAGLLVLATDTTRNYWVCDQTTYGYDTNFVYNSIQATYCSDLVVIDLANSLFQSFGGQSFADVTQGTVLSYLASKMSGYKGLKLITASDDAPLGYKNPKANISAPTITVSCEIKLDTAVLFIPLNVNISAVQQSSTS